MEINNDHPVILIDGECNLCRGLIRFIIKRDPRGVFRFGSLSTPPARELIRAHGHDPDQLDSVTLVEERDLHIRSDAVWRILRRMKQPWPITATLLRMIPRPLRERGYKFIAHNRTRWFGRSEQCMMMPEEWRVRFVDVPGESPVVCED